MGVIISLASSCKDPLPPPVSGGENGSGTLVLARESKGATKFDVYMNGNLLGSIGPGEIKTFTFSNNKQGNSLVLRHQATDLYVVNSEPLIFNINAGGTINVTCTFESWKARPILERRPDDSSAGISSVKVEIDPEVKMVEASTEIIKVVPGVTTNIKRSRTLEHKVIFSSNDERGNSISSKNEFLDIEVKNNIESLLGREFRQTETIEQEVRLDGNVNRQYKLIWYDKIRTGVVEYQQQSEVIRVRFQFKEWAELRVEIPKE